MTTLHTIPVDDVVEHDTTGPGCICGPRLIVLNDGDDLLYVHHSMDGREHSEPDHDKATCPLCAEDE